MLSLWSYHQTFIPDGQHIQVFLFLLLLKSKLNSTDIFYCWPSTPNFMKIQQIVQKLRLGSTIEEHSVQTSCQSTQPHTQWVPRHLSPGVNRPGREDDYWRPPTTAEVENVWSSTCTGLNTTARGECRSVLHNGDIIVRVNKIKDTRLGIVVRPETPPGCTTKQRLSNPTRQHRWPRGRFIDPGRSDITGACLAFNYNTLLPNKSRP